MTIVDDFRNSSTDVLEGILAIVGRSPHIAELDCTSEDFTGHLSTFGPFDAVVHFAALKSVGESKIAPLEYYRNNLLSLINILEYCKISGINKILFSSSATVYGQPDQLPVTEEARIKPAESVYGETKQMCERILRDFMAATPGFKSVILRYFNPVGAHTSGLIGELPQGIPNNLFPYITQTAAGRREILTVYGKDYGTPDGTCIRDFIHVVDLAKAHVAALDYLARGGTSDIFNIGTGRGYSVLEAIAAFEQTTRIKVKWKFGERRPGDVEKSWASAEKAEKVLGWKAERSLEDALRDAWHWESRHTARQ